MIIFMYFLDFLAQFVKLRIANCYIRVWLDTHILLTSNSKRLTKLFSGGITSWVSHNIILL